MTDQKKSDQTTSSEKPWGGRFSEPTDAFVEKFTASVGFGEKGHNELEAAALVAEHFGSRHYPEQIAPNLDEVIGPVTTHLGEPLADSSAIPTWYVSRAAKRHVTVALTGDGGDESFAGYDFRYVPLAMEAAARAPWPEYST